MAARVPSRAFYHEHPDLLVLETTWSMSGQEFELGTTVGRLATAWTPANPAVQVAIVRTRNPRHVDDAAAAAQRKLDMPTLRRIDEIVAAEVAVGGPSPETV